MTERIVAAARLEYLAVNALLGLKERIPNPDTSDLPEIDRVESALTLAHAELFAALREAEEL